MTLTVNYFTGELFIPNVAGTIYAEVENLALLSLMIKKYEAEFLEKLLGETLADEFVAAMALTPTSGVWYDLDQLIYRVDAPLYQSPAANYVYCKFWATAQTVTTQTGEMKAKTENSDRVSIGAKMIRAWNEMIDLADDIREYLNEHPTDYPNWGADEVEDWEKQSQWGI